MKARPFWLFTVLFCLLLGTTSGRAEGLLSDAAQKHFDAGLAYVDDPSGAKWEEALKEFHAAYAESPTWKLMNNIGLCALHLERDGEAIDAYGIYLQHGGEDDFTQKQKKQMERDIAMLSASLVRVTLEVDPPDAVIIDERRNAKGAVLVNHYEAKNGKASMGIHPGRHKLTIQVPGYKSAEWAFNAEPASTHQKRFKLESEKKPGGIAEPPKPSEQRTPTTAYVGLAATGLLAVAATVTGIMELSKQSEFDDAKQRGDRPAAQSASDTGKALALACDISIGAAIVGAGITTYLFVAGAKKPVEPPASPTAVNLVPMVGRGNIGLGLSSRF